MTLPRSGRFLAVMALAPFLSCHCPTGITAQVCASEPGNETDHPGACSTNADCSDHYQCSPSRSNAKVQCCLLISRKCNTEADCCPGQTCNPDAKLCADKFLDCKSGGNTACGNFDGGTDPDLSCQPWTEPYVTNSGVGTDNSNRCEFGPCDASGGCPTGQSCFQGQCMIGLPCGGSCPAGKACAPEAGKTGYCQAYACSGACQPGFIATFTDNINIWDTCNKANERCVCAELPPLRSNDLGRHSALAADTTANQLLVSLYDGQYGDLVVDKFDATGKLLKQQWVDGVPTSGTIVYGPSGPRGGITDPGTDVGRYTDVVVNGSFAYVSYYDATNGALKLAVRQADGQTWNTMQVDGTNGTLGLYTSVSVDAMGLPGISYFQKGGKTGFDATQCPNPQPTGPKAFVTALKFVRAKTANPASATDFTAPVLIACADSPVPACYGCTGTCADLGGGAQCYSAGSGAACSSCDPSTQVCVVGPLGDGGMGSVCGKKYNPSALADTPNGVGLFTSLQFTGQVANIAFQKRTLGVGQLYGVTLDANNVPSAPVLLDGNDDTGYFTNLKVHPTSGQILISYQDFTTRSLKFYLGSAGFMGGTTETIDTGAGPAGSGISAWVGASSTVMVASNGDVYAAYEDTTNNNLNLAVRKPTWTILNPLHTQGAVGFFADGAFLGNTLFVSHASLHAVKDPNAPSGVSPDNTLVLDQFTPP